MNRKLVSLLLVLMLMLTAAVSAEGITPSRTNQDMTQMKLPADVPPDFSLDIKTATDFSNDVIEKFDSFLKSGEKVIDFFPEETIREIEEQLPAGFDTSKLQIDEVLPLVMPASTPIWKT